MWKWMPRQPRDGTTTVAIGLRNSDWLHRVCVAAAGGDGGSAAWHAWEMGRGGTGWRKRCVARRGL